MHTLRRLSCVSRHVSSLRRFSTCVSARFRTLSNLQPAGLAQLGRFFSSKPKDVLACCLSDDRNSSSKKLKVSGDFVVGRRLREHPLQVEEKCNVTGGSGDEGVPNTHFRLSRIEHPLKLPKVWKNPTQNHIWEEEEIEKLMKSLPTHTPVTMSDKTAYV
eukprot:1387511-Amorphochlora_amoeboformis.AAC.1